MPLREKFPNTEFFGVRIFSYLDTFHTVCALNISVLTKQCLSTPSGSEEDDRRLGKSNLVALISLISIFCTPCAWVG